MTSSGLGYWLVHDFTNPNWWDQVIGTPVKLITVMLMLDHTNNTAALTAGQRAKVLELMDRSGYAESTPWTGANLADVMKVQIARGLIFSNATAVSAGFARVWKELYFSHASYDNIQVDGSFHQHSMQGVRGALLAGSYGTVFTTDMLGFVDLAHNTTLKVGPVAANVLGTLLLDGQRWMINRQQRWDWSVVGRGNSGADNGFGVDSFGGNAQYMTELELPDRAAELHSFAACLAGDAAAPPAPAAGNGNGGGGGSSKCTDMVGNKHFYDSDYQVHSRPGWMASVRMYSNRTIAARCVNKQGRKNSREADGVTNLFLASDTTYPYQNMFPAWDFHTLAGMSSEVNVPLLPCNGIDDYNTWPTTMNYTEFVGGVSDGMYGVAAMNLSSGTLHVHNAWFFGDVGYVHLGSNLKCTTGSQVVTSLANRLLGQGSVYVQQNPPRQPPRRQQQQQQHGNGTAAAAAAECPYKQLEGCYTKGTCIAATKSARYSTYCYGPTVDPDWGTCVALNCSAWCPQLQPGPACSRSSGGSSGGSGISEMGGPAVPLAKGNHSFPAESVAWVWHASKPTTDGDNGAGAGVGYIPIFGASATAPQFHVNNDVRSGAWSDLGTSTGVSTVETLEVQLAHGQCKDLKEPSAAGSGFGYGVLPNIALNDLKVTVSSSGALLPWKVLANTPDVQAVGWQQANGASVNETNVDRGLKVKSMDRIQAVFWTASPHLHAAVGFVVSASAPCIVMATKLVAGTETTIEVAVSSPLSTVAAVDIVVAGAWKGRGCTPGQTPTRAHAHARGAAAESPTTVFSFSLPKGDFQGKTTSLNCTSN